MAIYDNLWHSERLLESSWVLAHYVAKLPWMYHLSTVQVVECLAQSPGQWHKLLKITDPPKGKDLTKDVPLSSCSNTTLDFTANEFAASKSRFCWDSAKWRIHDPTCSHQVHLSPCRNSRSAWNCGMKLQSHTWMVCQLWCCHPEEFSQSMLYFAWLQVAAKSAVGMSKYVEVRLPTTTSVHKQCD